MKENLDAAKSIIDSIPFNVWFIFATLLTLTCFWLTAIYLIVPGYYHATPVYIYVMTGFVLAVLWYAGTVAFMLLVAYNPEKPYGALNRPVWQLFYLVSAYISLLLVGLSIFAGYVFQLRFRYLVATDFFLLYSFVTLGLYGETQLAKRRQMNK